MPLSTRQVEDIFTRNDDWLQTTLLHVNLTTPVNQKAVITNINKLLSIQDTRDKGLRSITQILHDCPTHLFLENFTNWLSFSSLRIGQHDKLAGLKLNTVGTMIENFYKEGEFSKKFVSEYLYKFFEYCMANEQEPFTIKFLAISMKCYPSWFNQHKGKVEVFLLKFLDCCNRNSVLDASGAFHVLQQVGTAGTNGITHITNFSNQFHRICKTVHSLYDKLFENHREVETYDTGLNSELDAIIFDNSTSDYENMQEATIRRLENCIVFISTMITKKFPVAKEIRPNLLLDVISRGLQLHACLEQEDLDLHSAEFTFILIKLQNKLLVLFRLTMTWLQHDLVIFASAIKSMLINTLKRCQACNCFMVDKTMQENVYKNIIAWILLAKISVRGEFQTQLTNCILKDITVKKSTLKLTMTGSLEKNKSAKAKHREIVNRVIESSPNNTLSNLSGTQQSTQRNNCKFALMALKQLLTDTSYPENDKALMNVYKTVVQNLLDIQAGKKQHPFNNTECQVKLYEVLIALYDQDQAALPPLQQSLIILQSGIKENNHQIRQTCEAGLNILEKICQPVCPAWTISTYSNNKNVTGMNDSNIVYNSDPAEIDVSPTSSEKTVIVSKLTGRPFNETTLEKDPEPEQEFNSSVINDSLSIKEEDISDSQNEAALLFEEPYPDEPLAKKPRTENPTTPPVLEENDELEIDEDALLEDDFVDEVKDY